MTLTPITATVQRTNDKLISILIADRVLTPEERAYVDACEAQQALVEIKGHIRDLLGAIDRGHFTDPLLPNSGYVEPLREFVA